MRNFPALPALQDAAIAAAVPVSPPVAAGEAVSVEALSAARRELAVRQAMQKEGQQISQAEVDAAHVRLHALTQERANAAYPGAAVPGIGQVLQQLQALQGQVQAQWQALRAQMQAQGQAQQAQMQALQLSVERGFSLADAHLRNSGATHVSSQLVAVPTVHDEVPPNFPATRGDLLDMAVEDVNSLLVAYRQAPAATGQERRALAQYIGVPNV